MLYHSLHIEPTPSDQHEFSIALDKDVTNWYTFEAFDRRKPAQMDCNELYKKDGITAAFRLHSDKKK